MIGPMPQRRDRVAVGGQELRVIHVELLEPLAPRDARRAVAHLAVLLGGRVRDLHPGDRLRPREPHVHADRVDAHLHLADLLGARACR